MCTCMCTVQCLSMGMYMYVYMCLFSAHTCVGVLGITNICNTCTCRYLHTLLHIISDKIFSYTYTPVRYST